MELVGKGHKGIEGVRSDLDRLDSCFRRNDGGGGNDGEGGGSDDKVSGSCYCPVNDLCVIPLSVSHSFIYSSFLRKQESRTGKQGDVELVEKGHKGIEGVRSDLDRLDSCFRRNDDGGGNGGGGENDGGGGNDGEGGRNDGGMTGVTIK